LVRLKEITPTSLKFSVSCWVNDINKAGSAQDELLQEIHQSLDNAGIRYPQKKDSGTES
jgi:small-conductance mechanosensitive channel